jgi:DNA-binding NarL/FixJ family response regulator
LTYAEYQDLLDHLRKGVPMRTIADQFGISLNAVVQIARKNHITRKHGLLRSRTKEAKKLLAARNKRLLELYRQGMTYYNIGQEFNLTERTVRDTVQKEKKRAGEVQKR